ncbi:MAG: phosphoribosyltransferase [Spirochaetaceae bacterium]|nr:phosphoribosyltransferase [Spirochaetaceae bacterium]MCF7948074.1 phosphoribosyltransferase [Spirochaetia bacterium]MCF7950435.1 phosphoribosyltransferase [Spirochaetaceae bacterium]
MAEPAKLYFSYNDIHKTVKSLAQQIKSSGYEPELMVAIGTGGFIPARILKTFVEKPVYTVGISYYDRENKPKDAPQKIQWIDEVEQKLEGKKILLVDEVDDSRATLEYCLRELLKHKPREIAVAVLHNKRKDKRGIIPEEVDHYFAGRELDDLWICYPWDADDIDYQDKMSK